MRIYFNYGIQNLHHIIELVSAGKIVYSKQISRNVNIDGKNIEC